MYSPGQPDGARGVRKMTGPAQSGAACTEPSGFRGERVGCRGTYSGFLQGSMHRAINFQRGVCRLLQNLHWIPTRLHAHRLATEIQSGPKDEVKQKCTNNLPWSDSDGSECKYIFLRLNNRKPSKNRPRVWQERPGAIPLFDGRVGAASFSCWGVVGHCECGMQV